MPGSIGTDPTQDGVLGDTQASGKNGVVGTNSSTIAIPAGQPGGNGVFGFTQNPNASGVFGSADGGGTGIAGFSSLGDGTRGDTKSSGKNGLVGTNGSTDVIPAGQPGGNGVFGYTQNPHASGVFGSADGGGTGIAGFSSLGDGTRGDTKSSGKNGLVGTNGSTDVIPAGQPGGNGVFGYTQNPHASGVFGSADGGGTGIAGFSSLGDGTRGDTKSSGKNGLVGTNGSTDVIPAGQPGGNGVFGYTQNPHASGVFGSADGGGTGIAGFSSLGDGTRGDTKSSGKNGLVGTNGSTDVIPAGQPGGNGVFGYTQNPHASGVFGSADGGGTGISGYSANGIGVRGTGKVAGHFDGNVEVTGDVLLLGADCAENFDIGETERVDPGSVMVIDDFGKLRVCRESYDRRVAGVISGAGNFRPAIIMDHGSAGFAAQSIALIGKVYCKVDADLAPIKVGDLLTTSATCGYAMKAEDVTKAFGSVLGKALRSLQHGKGLVPILVTLQ